MATRLHSHPHSRNHAPIRSFAMEHPYAAEWLILAIGTLAAFLLWLWNT